MSNGEKPDGFVAWHPEKGIERIAGRSVNGVESNYIEVEGQMSTVAYWSDAFRKNQQGWRIRPVKLVFLDEAGHEQR